LLEQALDNGTPVVALVPPNATEASKIFPIDQAKRDAPVPRAGEVDPTTVLRGAKPGG
jgi:hypothetical protein